MSAPYRIVNFYHDTLVKLDQGEALVTAIAIAKMFRQSAVLSATVHGDNVDLGCVDGLNQDEREQVEEALG